MTLRLLSLATGMAILSATATAGVIQFTELSTRPVDGVSLLGVTFDFKIAGVDSTDATFGKSGPGNTSYVAGLGLEGNTTGTLTIDFAGTTDIFQFGLAFNSTSNLTPGATIELFDGTLGSIGSFGLNTSPQSTAYTEGLFSYNASPISRAVVMFNTGPGRFIMDNLTYEINDAPEPGTLAMLGAGMLLFGAFARRKRCSPGCDVTASRRT